MFNNRTGTFLGLDSFTLLILIIAVLIAISILAVPLVQEVLRELAPLLRLAQLGQP